MRPIKFRGKCIAKGELNGKWVYGDLLQKNQKTYITPHVNAVQVNSQIGQMIIMHEVDSETTGQYTGVQDKRGKQIYEGDIVNVQHMLVETVLPYRAVVEWDKYRFAIRNLDSPDYQMFIYPMNNLDPFGLNLEVIGTLHTDPHLLEATT